MNSSDPYLSVRAFSLLSEETCTYSQEIHKVKNFKYLLSNAGINIIPDVFSQNIVLWNVLLSNWNSNHLLKVNEPYFARRFGISRNLILKKNTIKDDKLWEFEDSMMTRVFKIFREEVDEVRRKKKVIRHFFMEKYSWMILIDSSKWKLDNIKLSENIWNFHWGTKTVHFSSFFRHPIKLFLSWHNYKRSETTIEWLLQWYYESRIQYIWGKYG